MSVLDVMHKDMLMHKCLCDLVLLCQANLFQSCLSGVLYNCFILIIKSFII